MVDALTDAPNSRLGAPSDLIFAESRQETFGLVEHISDLLSEGSGKLVQAAEPDQISTLHKAPSRNDAASLGFLRWALRNGIALKPGMASCNLGVPGRVCQES